MPTNVKIWYKSLKDMCYCGAFICQTFGKIFSFWGLISPCTDRGAIWRKGVNRRTQEDTIGPYTAQGATCRPYDYEAKTSKSPRVTEMPALCAVRMFYKIHTNFNTRSSSLYCTEFRDTLQAVYIGLPSLFYFRR